MQQFRKGRLDPLELLREYIIDKKIVKVKNKNGEYRLVFENHALEMKFQTETAWKSPKSQKEYKLGALWWFLECKLKGIDNKEYRNKAFEMGIDFIGKADQDEILDYFTGKIDYTECINAERKSQIFKKYDQYEEQGTVKKVKVEEKEVIRYRKQPLSEKEFNLKVLDEILRFEKPITTRNRLFRVQDKTFEGILNISKQIFHGQVEKESEDVSVQSQNSLLSKLQKNKEKPIIIVPQIPETGNLCLKNAVEFLQNGKYLEASQVKLVSEDRQIQFKVKLKQSNTEQVFVVTDLPNVISAKDWPRVVAIFLRGSEHEIKNFPEQDPAVLFKAVRAYHLKFEDDKVKDYIKLHHIRVLELHRIKRHYDQVAHEAFWDDLEKFMLKSIVHK